MKSVIRWFCWLQVVGVAHMFEQILFGLDELQELKHGVAQFQALFSNSDVGTTLLVIVFYCSAALLVYGALVSRRGALWVTSFFGVFGIAEAHHFVRVALKQGYNPGCITAVAFVSIGWLLLRASLRELRTLPKAAAPVRVSIIPA